MQATAARGVFEPYVPKAYDTTLQLSLSDAIRIGLENNLDIKVSRLDDSQRNRDLVVAKSVFDPFFNLGADYQKNRDPSVSFFDIGAGAAAQGVSISPSETISYFTGVSGRWFSGATYDVRLGQVQRDRPVASAAGFTFLNPVTTTDFSFSAKQPLLRGAWWDTNLAEVHIAQNNLALSREQLELTLINTVFLIESAYWEVAFAGQNLEAKVKAYQLTLDNLENVRKKKAVGVLAAIDVTTAESQAAIRRVELVDAIELRETVRDRLLDIINYSGEHSLKAAWEAGEAKGAFHKIMVQCTTVPAATSLTPSRDRALAAAFDRRSEYRQLELLLQNQDIRIDVARNGILPAVDLTGRWTQLGLEQSWENSYEEFESGRYYDWEVGIQFSVPLSNRGPRSLLRNARDEQRKIRIEKTKLENQIVLEIDQNLRRIDFLERKVADLDERVRLQQELLQAERKKLDVGMSIVYTVSVIENDLVENVAEALRAKTSLQIARADLLRAMGTLLDRHNIVFSGGGTE